MVTFPSCTCSTVPFLLNYGHAPAGFSRPSPEYLRKVTTFGRESGQDLEMVLRIADIAETMGTDASHFIVMVASSQIAAVRSLNGVP